MIVTLKCVDNAREPEIEHLDHALLFADQHEVFRLYVAVDDAVLVGIGECVEYLNYKVIGLAFV